MTDDLQEIDGIGPAREEDLNELGYEEYSDLAEADPAELAEDVERLPEDSALELIVQAQNLAELEDAQVEEEPEVAPEEFEEEDDADHSDEEEIESEATEDDSEDSEDEPEVIEFALEFDGPTQFDAFFHAVYDARRNMYRTNRPEKAGPYEKLLDALRATDAEGTVEAELTADGLNDLHNELRDAIVGSDMKEEGEALRELEVAVNAIREEYLF